MSFNICDGKLFGALNLTVVFTCISLVSQLGIILCWLAVIFRLHILSNIPETIAPGDYGELLPVVQHGEVVDYHQQSLREPDWCEMSGGDSDAQPLTPAVLAAWYTSRACDIEKKSRLVDHALQFVELGMTNGVEVWTILHVSIYVLQYRERIHTAICLFS